DDGDAHLHAPAGKTRDRAGAEAELDEVSTGDRGRIAKQRPRHHAADVLELDRERCLDPHRALDPGRAEVEIANAARLRDCHLGKRRSAASAAPIAATSAGSLRIVAPAARAAAVR